MHDALYRLWRTPQGVIGTGLLLVLLSMCVFGRFVAPYEPDAIDFLGRFAPPGAKHWFGADQLGRDVLSRLLVGAYATIPLALFATFFGTALGATIGTLSAYLGGRWDEFTMRTVDAILAIPHLLLALILVSSLGKGSLNAALAIGISFAPSMARVTRSVALSVRQQDYVKAAIARGESGSWIVFREMLPNVAAPVIVEATIRVSFAVMSFATLSFLGLGAQPPASEWGLMVSEARHYLHQAPWVIIFPSLAIALTAICFNLLGDGLRDALNPRDDR
ncbi:ABC transporter permease [Bosea sp. (in: a-proteobacteria)]|uniref:ABC transporter permease n=1 Tax=Bosea sp. (in: a-proteobacteria) TaxID=1871050 RepID=UPI00261E91F0|nr:ABC transporter permease [Bosea sp. (in: a-proteobacteria)]MCO5092585.1 ABC transporter permease [Bosea sp. (in: a-proteobacteria)]